MNTKNETKAMKANLQNANVTAPISGASKGIGVGQDSSAFREEDQPDAGYFFGERNVLRIFASYVGQCRILPARRAELWRIGAFTPLLFFRLGVVVSRFLVMVVS